jgi:hypothetical protein
VIEKLNLFKKTLIRPKILWGSMRLGEVNCKSSVSYMKPRLENKWINQEKENANWYIYTFAFCMPSVTTIL